MSEVMEAIRGAFGLIVGGIIILALVNIFAGTSLDTGAFDLRIVGILAVFGGLALLAVIVVVIIGRLLE